MKQTSLPLRWILIVVLAQLGWGGYPVFLRYLQTVSEIPGLSLLAMGNLLVLLIVGIAFFPRIDKQAFRLPIVWVFGLMVVLRGITNLLANRFTLSIYAQLIYLMTPFLVAIMSRVLLREMLPKYTVRALVIALVGALLMMSGDIGAVGGETAVYRNDPLGISMAVASSIALAVYMIVVRRTAKHRAPGEALLMVHLVSLFSFSMIASLVFREDWGQWQQLGSLDWIVFALLAGGVLLGANLGQIRSIQHLGAPLVSNMMAGRLISALLFGGLLLQERLTSLWEVVGMAVVIVTITWYLWQQ